jgi:TonB family protein
MRLEPTLGRTTPMAFLPESRQPDFNTTELSSFEHQQRRRMLVALLVLLLALVLVLVKDRELLFPATQSPDAEVMEPEETQPLPAPVTASQPPALSVPETAKKKEIHLPQRKPIVATILPSTRQSGPPIVVATSRAVLPPLRVEVVAGNQRHPVDTGTNSVSVKMQDGLSPQPQTMADAAPVNASAHVELSPDAAHVISHPVDPSYPLLAKQMKVQGAVVMEALIGKNGSIQEIQVLSGPAILSAAAREAVRQWRFKPYLQSGRPVDSEARITVNFTISTY